MPGIGYVTTGTFNSTKETYMLPTDESVCGLLFDCSDFSLPFYDYPLISQYFEDGQTQLINNLTEAEMFGLTDNGFMNGVPYYHIKQFYDYIGTDAPLYICFTSETQEWGAIESMQMAASGKIFQIGVWTSKRMWAPNNSKLQFTTLASNLEAAAEVVCGKVGKQSLNSTPLSIILSPNTYFSESGYTLQDIPDATVLNMPKLSVCLMQNGSDEVHAMQNKNPNNAPVGCIGLAMACFYLAYAEECIGYVAKFNLNKNDDINNAEIWLGTASYPVTDISYIVGNLTAQKGYIVPCEYSNKVSEVFFSGDPTLSDGDYCQVANNRIMHKVRRAIHSALIPYIGNHNLLENGALSSASESILTNAVSTMVNSVMVNAQGQSQINGCTVSVTKSSDILKDDSISIDASIGLVNYNKTINEKDDYEV